MGVYLCQNLSQVYTLIIFSLLYFSSTSTKFFTNKIKHHKSSTRSLLSRWDTKNNNNDHEAYLLSLLWQVFWTQSFNWFSMDSWARCCCCHLKVGKPRLRDMGWPAPGPSFSKRHSRHFSQSLRGPRAPMLYPTVCVFMDSLNWVSFMKIGSCKTHFSSCFSFVSISLSVAAWHSAAIGTVIYFVSSLQTHI